MVKHRVHDDSKRFVDSRYVLFPGSSVRVGQRRRVSGLARFAATARGESNDVFAIADDAQGSLDAILRDGARAARERAAPTLDRVFEVSGFIPAATG